MRQFWMSVLRTVKYLDFPIQTMVMGTAMLSIFCYRDGDGTLLLLLTYIATGLWQMFSATLFLLARAPFYRTRIAHFVLSVLCLVWFKNSMGTGFLILVPPGMLALFYYTITVLWTFKKPQTRGFLRHISF